MPELEWLSVDREVRTAAGAWRRWRRSVREGHGLLDDPFTTTRAVATRTQFERVQELDPSHPLREPLRRWIYRLTEQRVNRSAWALTQALLRAVTHPVEQPERAELSLAELLQRALSDPPRRAAWFDAYLARTGPLVASTALLWERRQEVATRLGLPSPDAIELPHPDLVASASDFLQTSAPLGQEHRRRDLAEVVSLALGSDAGEGWPAVLAPRTLVDLLGAAPWLDGLDLEPGPLPCGYGAASFLRAFARVGAAWVDACAPEHQPFVVAHDPWGLRRRTVGALWALLPLGSEFVRRRLRVGAPRIRDTLRSVGRVVLLESRSAALRVQLRPAALRGRSAFAEAFEAEVERAFGVALPGPQAGAVWRLHLDDGQRLVGLWLAADLADSLREEHDEDWFRSPRAADQLRSWAALSPEPYVTTEQLARGRRALARRLDEVL
jgi:hypothetical protein